MGAHQNTGEKLEDWADRLLSLAMKAFCDLPEHIYSQAVGNSVRDAVIKMLVKMLQCQNQNLLKTP
jgi:hypothetical protein